MALQMVPHSADGVSHSSTSTDAVTIAPPRAILAEPSLHGVQNDALPYIDTEGDDPTARAAADAEIAAEMRTMAQEGVTTENYSERLPSPPPPLQFGGSDFLRTAYERVAAKADDPEFVASLTQPAASSSDAAPLPSAPPAGTAEAADTAAWQSALDGLKTAFEAEVRQLLTLKRNLFTV